MVLLAVLLMIAIVALTIGVFLAETDSAGFEVLEESFNVTGGGVFAAGLITGLAIVGAGWMLLVGLRRSTIRRRELKELWTARERHQQELDKERRAHEAEKAELASRTLVRPYVGGGGGAGDRPPERPNRTGQPGGRPLGSPIEARPGEIRPVERPPRPAGPPGQPPP